MILIRPKHRDINYPVIPLRKWCGVRDSLNEAHDDYIAFSSLLAYAECSLYETLNTHTAKIVRIPYT